MVQYRVKENILALYRGTILLVKFPITKKLVVMALLIFSYSVRNLSIFNSCVMLFQPSTPNAGVENVFSGVILSPKIESYFCKSGLVLH